MSVELFQKFYSVRCIAARHRQTFNSAGQLIGEIEVQTGYTTEINPADVYRISPVDENSKRIALDDKEADGKSTVIPKFARTVITVDTPAGRVSHFISASLNDILDDYLKTDRLEILSALILSAHEKVSSKPVTCEDFGTKRPASQLRHAPALAAAL